MKFDERTHIRELGLRKILLKAKNDKRKLSERGLDFNSTDYVDLINWTGCRVTVPPILSDMSEEQLKSLVTGHSPPIMELQSFPFHTQSVERCVTEAAAPRCLWRRQQRCFYSSMITITKTDVDI